MPVCTALDGAPLLAPEPQVTRVLRNGPLTRSIRRASVRERVGLEEPQGQPGNLNASEVTPTNPRHNVVATPPSLASQTQV